MASRRICLGTNGVLRNVPPAPVVAECLSWGNEPLADIGQLFHRPPCDFVALANRSLEDQCFDPHFRFEPTLEDETASISHNPRMGLGSAPEKGETICKHTLQDQLPAFR